MSSQKGFTLMELLIAAVIIGTLALFAMQSFRGTSADIRIQDAQNRARIVAVAARQFLMDYPSAAVTENDPDADPKRVMGRVQDPHQDVAAGDCSTAVLSLQNLVNCGYLEFRQYAAEIRDEDGSFSTNFDMYFGGADGTVCIRGNNVKITDGNEYCTNGD